MRNAKSIQTKSRKHEVEQTGPQTFTVTSSSSGSEYQVTLGEVTCCSCDWGKYRKAGQSCSCSHVVSVYNHLSEKAGYKVMAWGSQEEARKQHRTQVEIGDGLFLTVRKAA